MRIELCCFIKIKQFTKNLKMKGSTLRIDQPEYRPQASSFTKITNQKLTTGLSTFNMSKQKSECQSIGNTSLSKLILKHEDFWAKKFMKNQKENSSQALNLKINSILSTSSRKMHSFNDLSVNSKSEKRSMLGDYEHEKLSVNNSFAQAIYQCGHSEENDVFELQLQTKNDSINLNQSLNSSKATKTKISTSQILHYFRLIEQLGTVGHWCNMYLRRTQIRWENVSILLYIQCYRRIQQMEVGDIVGDSCAGIQQNVIEMLQINKQLENIVENLAVSGNNFLIFAAIVKESKKMLEDIMKEQQIKNRDIQFCMHKTIISLGILASFNGMSTPQLSTVNDKSELSPQTIKNNLKLYKEIINFSENFKPIM